MDLPLSPRAWLLVVAASLIWIGVTAFVDDGTPLAAIWLPMAALGAAASILLWLRPTALRLQLWSASLSSFAVVRGIAIAHSDHLAAVGIWTLMLTIVLRLHVAKRDRWWSS